MYPSPFGSIRQGEKLRRKPAVGSAFFPAWNDGAHDDNDQNYMDSVLFIIQIFCGVAVDKCHLQFSNAVIVASFSTMPNLWALWSTHWDHNILVNDFLPQRAQRFSS